MKAWLDFLPIILFFIAYKLEGVFVAAAVLMVAVVVIYGAMWWQQRRLETSQWITVAATLGLGSLTLILHDEKYLQWKAPGVYVLLALVFLGSQWFGSQPIIQRMMGHAVTLKPAQWRGLNLSWAAFFLLSAAANAVVVLYWTAYWVDFKLFGSMAMTFIFVIAQGVWLMKQGAITETNSAP
ncbi:intracellular septation protein [Paraperlucidibaca baekdonensis]|uniref:Inner membrane-spanning protein YciB n=1 Tax=Paraperlucidibaca baekdonensis TaxID=748120 RepID=A0A3E0H1A2_9GAMM|nr:septation protein IspZ [Paraperlucidibaca baekdonensis]REH36882.1 intracellular septation protein [Paraperlucidibaca baekdonensis]